MREIEFRGKNLDGEWLLGTGITDETGMIPRNGFFIYSDYNWEIVIPETIGQYSGLKDKNGKKIFEGDFLINGDNIMLVIFRKDLASFALSKKGWLHDHFFQEAVSNSDCEIIGNIHDNPELLR